MISAYANTRITISEQENPVRGQKIFETLPEKIDRNWYRYIELPFHCRAGYKHEFSHSVILTIVKSFRKAEQLSYRRKRLTWLP